MINFSLEIEYGLKRRHPNWEPHTVRKTENERYGGYVFYVICYGVVKERHLCSGYGNIVPPFREELGIVLNHLSHTVLYRWKTLVEKSYFKFVIVHV